MRLSDLLIQGRTLRNSRKRPLKTKRSRGSKRRPRRRTAEPVLVDVPNKIRKRMG